MSSREFSEWLAFQRHEPIGVERLDILFASLSALLANVNRDEKQRPEPYQMSDFLIEWWREAEPERAAVSGGKTPDEIYLAVKTWAMIAGAKKAQ
jgi:hypothetical protein